MTMRILITGANGQLGRALCATAPQAAELLPRSSAQLDVSDLEEVSAIIGQERPTVIINAAAYTAVDKAEQESSRAHAVNGRGPAHLAQAANAVGARLIHISTDYVFDGSHSRPYQPNDPCHPSGVYGASKRAGEEGVLAIAAQALIIRTAWLYGDGHNFVRTMLRLMAERREIGVVADQIGTPTWSHTLAAATWAAVAKPDLRGIYHWSDAGAASWYDFAVAIQEEALALGLLQRPITIKPIRSEDYPTPARRPAYSVLDKTASWHDFEVAPIHWREALRQMLRCEKQD
jgi:dTDP-4-dehydrorhamnose reductase